MEENLTLPPNRTLILNHLHEIFEKALGEDNYQRHPDGQRLLLKVSGTLYAIDVTPWTWPQGAPNE